MSENLLSALWIDWSWQVAGAAGVVFGFVVYLLGHALWRDRTLVSAHPQVEEANKLFGGLDKGRRRSVRIRENYVEVVIADRDSGRVFPGWIADRSRTGLRVMTDHPVIVGNTIRIRLAGFSDDRWTEVIVRRCAPSGPRWEVGCEFVDPAPVVKFKRTG
ncbi:MAG: hypothetical protein KatS3mg105_2708 [Gemmatales bacterium]|nr:MAG: hypothetical protein KatS3mg105_2708 [Gemmatales bacterium]